MLYNHFSFKLNGWPLLNKIDTLETCDYQSWHLAVWNEVSYYSSGFCIFQSDL
jgi:hypothetical protein